ncbi:MAG: dnaG, partial [Verrucomicrobiales bacterium]|nr:dnaG [Verrucomicrobiales bacterium]
IGSYIPLKRAGLNFVALCPFHKEKSPSFNVNPSKQIFHCFGCHKGGNVITFVMEYESLSFVEAIRRLANRANIVLEEVQSEQQGQLASLKDTLLKIHEQIAQRWHNYLLKEAGAQIARDYLEKRGVSSDSIRQFKLGYAPEAWDDTVNWGKSKSFLPEHLEKSGLILQQEQSGRYYDRFRGRLMFPICDDQGRVVAFSGRILSGDEKTAKYVNSPETPLFSKGKIIFGLDKAKRALLDAKTAIICEGQLDLIACHAAEVKNVVAPQGTALTADHSRILKRYVEEVILCFDADNAGQNATLRSLDSLLTNGLNIRVALLPSPHDPDSFIKEFGAQAFRDKVMEAEGFFDWFLKRLMATNDVTADKGRVAVIQAMAQNVAKTNNNTLIDTYAQKTAIRLGVSAEATRKDFKKYARATPSLEENPEQLETETVATRPNQQEFWLLKLTLQRDDLVEWVAAHLDLSWVNHSLVRAILAERFELEGDGNWRGTAAWMSSLEDDPQRQLITEAITESPNADAEQILKGTPTRLGVVQLLRNQFLEIQISENNRQLMAPEISDETRLRLLMEKQNLRTSKNSPLVPLSDQY